MGTIDWLMQHWECMEHGPLGCKAGCAYNANSVHGVDWLTDWCPPTIYMQSLSMTYIYVSYIWLGGEGALIKSSCACMQPHPSCSLSSLPPSCVHQATGVCKLESSEGHCSDVTRCIVIQSDLTWKAFIHGRELAHSSTVSLYINFRHKVLIHKQKSHFIPYTGNATHYSDCGTLNTAPAILEGR